MDFIITVDIAAPAERVWAIISDVERWHEWTASVTSIELLDPGALAPGHRARVRQPKLLPAIWTITSLDRGRSFTWRSGAPGIWVFGRHSVEPAGTGSRATLALKFEGMFSGIVAWILSGLNNRYLNLEAAGLKRRSEEDR